MGGLRHPHAQRKLALRRFLNPFYTHFTTKDDGTTWSRHKQTLQLAPHYTEGLLQPGSGKTMRGIAKNMDLDEDRVQRFVTESPWSYRDLQKHLNHAIPPGIASEQAALVVDEVGLLKKGKHSVGVQRQYSGAAGRVENSQVAVDLILATPGGQRNADQHTWPLGFTLYLPESWCDDPERRQAAEIPDEIRFQTKPMIAWDMIQRAIENEVPHRCVIGDAVYGESWDLRRNLREHDEPYVLGIQPHTMQFVLDEQSLQEGDPVPGDVPTGTARELARHDASWHEVAWTKGEKGALRAAFARWRVRRTEPGHHGGRRATDESGWLLAERVGDRTKFYLAWGFDDASLEELGMYAHLRWTIEKFHRDAKQDLALDSFEGRSWTGWHHHMTLVLLAFAFLATLRAEGGGLAPPPKLTEVIHVLLVERAYRLGLEEGAPPALARRMAQKFVRRMTDY